VIPPAKIERRIRCKWLARLFNFPIAGKDKTSKDQRLRTRSAFYQPAINEDLVRPDFCHGVRRAFRCAPPPN
jgi:hypothetical protein